jgi:ABC-type Fe3+-hydroxamate transport system substrate-binding protein
MNRFFYALIALGLVSALTFCTGKNAEESTKSTTQTSAEDPVKRGEYLVGICGCNDCHTPKTMTAQGPVPDAKRLLSGHPSEEALPAVTDKKMIAPGQWALFNGSLTAAVGPWGTTFAANITPDDTGIGTWTYEQFEKVMREGKSKGLDGTRPILPPMPWVNYINMADTDMRAIFAYLKSIPAVKNAVPNPIPPAAG